MTPIAYNTAAALAATAEHLADAIDDGRPGWPLLAADARVLLDQLDPAPPGPVPLWRHVATLTAWLDDAHPRTGHEVACRVMKLAEETGEVVNAYLGMTGQNPRKGTCKTLDDLTAELCDVIITAMVALATVTADDPRDAQARLQQHVNARFARLLARIGQETPPGAEPGEWGCAQCGAAFFGTPPDDQLCPGCQP